MKWIQIVGIIFIIFVLIVLSQTTAIWLATGKSNNVGKFNVSSERIVKDLDGKAVSLMLNQVWPFEASQNINIQVISKKQLDEYVIVVVEIKALAAIQHADSPKEQFSTTTSAKNIPKNVKKLPSKLQLVGRMKLTYELIDNDWYLLTVDNLNLKPVAID